MHKYLYIFSLILLFIACKKEPSVEPAPETTPQTTIMYMTGTSLSGAFSSNIAAAKEAIAKGGLGYSRLLVFRQTSSTRGSLIEYKYKKGECVYEVIKTYDDIVSLTKEAFVEVIADAKEFAPADSYNMIISGHATGWVTKNFYPSTAWRVASNSTPIDWDIMMTSPIVTRYLGGGYDGIFDIEELKSSLEATNTHFGYILFDSCFMSSIEAIYNLRNLCDYIIASPCEVMGNGFPYDTVIPKLFANNGREVDFLGACKEYVDFYATSYPFESACVAVTVTSEIEALADITHKINTSTSINEVNLDEIQPYERLKNHVFFDFEQYMLAKCADSDLSKEFSVQMELTFPSAYRLHTNRFFANTGPSVSNDDNYAAYYTTIEYYSGVTTSAPTVQSNEMSNAWSTTAWALRTSN